MQLSLCTLFFYFLPIHPPSFHRYFHQLFHYQSKASIKWILPLKITTTSILKCTKLHLFVFHANVNTNTIFWSTRNIPGKKRALRGRKFKNVKVCWVKSCRSIRHFMQWETRKNLFQQRWNIYTVAQFARRGVISTGFELFFFFFPPEFLPRSALTKAYRRSSPVYPFAPSDATL